MTDILSEAFSAALRSLGRDVWEAMSDAERMITIREQIAKMTIESLLGRPLTDPEAC